MEINNKIESLQNMSNKALADSIHINSSIGSIGTSIQAIAAAIEEQAAVLNEIVLSMQNASEGISQLNNYTKKMANFNLSVIS